MSMDNENFVERLRETEAFKKNLLESVRNGFDIYKKIDGKNAVELIEERITGEKEQNDFRKELLDEYNTYQLKHRQYPRAVRSWPIQKEYE